MQLLPSIPKKSTVHFWPYTKAHAETNKKKQQSKTKRTQHKREGFFFKIVVYNCKCDSHTMGLIIWQNSSPIICANPPPFNLIRVGIPACLNKLPPPPSSPSWVSFSVFKRSFLERRHNGVSPSLLISLSALSLCLSVSLPPFHSLFPLFSAISLPPFPFFHFLSFLSLSPSPFLSFYLLLLFSIRKRGGCSTEWHRAEKNNTKWAWRTRPNTKRCPSWKTRHCYSCTNVSLLFVVLVFLLFLLPWCFTERVLRLLSLLCVGKGKKHSSTFQIQNGVSEWIKELEL